MKIVTVVDDNYAVPVQALAKSLRHHGHELTVMARYPSDFGEKFDPLRRLGCDIHFSFKQYEIEQFAHVPNISYVKAELPGIFPEEERILYLDGDTVCMGDLSELETMDMEGHPTAGVVDTMWHLVGHNFRDEAIDDLTAMIGHDVNKPAFNCGVMLMDVEKWLADDIGEKIVSFGSNPPTNSMVLGDQGAIALYHRGNFKKLNKRWNTSYKARNHYVDEETLILHWHGQKKPWNTELEHGDIWHHYNEMK